MPSMGLPAVLKSGDSMNREMSKMATVSARKRTVLALVRQRQEVARRIADLDRRICQLAGRTSALLSQDLQGVECASSLRRLRDI